MTNAGNQIHVVPAKRSASRDDDQEEIWRYTRTAVFGQYLSRR